MPTKTAGTQAPPLELKTSDGRDHSLYEALKSHPLVVLAFFKISCPVCQFTFPFLQRLHQAYPNVPIWGVSQDDAEDTAAFARDYGKVAFPMVLDEKLDYTVKYGLVSVPSIFVVRQDRTIEQAIFGFAKADLEQLNELMAKAGGSPLKPLFTEQDDVPTLRPG